MRRQWNDPAIGQAFANLAQMFAPPGGSDMHGFAQARLANQQADQRAALWDYALRTEGFDRELFDRKGLVLGAWGPNNSFHALDMADATTRRQHDIAAQNALDVQGMRNVQSMREALLGVAANPQGRQAIDPDMLERMIGPGFAGLGFDAAQPVAPTEAQVMGGQAARLIDEDKISDEMLVANFFGNTPTETIRGPDGRPVIVTRPQALGQTPVETGDMGNLTRFLIPGSDGEMQTVSGFTTNGRVVMPDGTDITHLNPIPTSNSGGTQFEIDPQGRIIFRMGGDSLTNRTASDLQRSRESAVQLRNSMTSLFRNLTADSLGAAGQVNDEFVNRFVAQFVPNAARLDVAAQRTQLRAAIVSEARGILRNDRLNREDRERIEQLMPDPNTIFESLPRSQAALATVAALAAYDAAFADERLGGGTLPPISPQIIGQLVDRGELEPDVAQMAVQTLFPGPRRDTAPMAAPSGAAPEAAPPQSDAGGVLEQARAAIAAGADPAAVAERLRQMGVDPGALQ